MISFFTHIPVHERRMTLATWFTVLRIVLTPFIVIAIMYQRWTLACCLFICAALTDVIDGFLARRFNQKTLLGACLDPIADKILLVSCFGALTFIDTPFFHVPHWFFYIICVKEVIQFIGGVLLFFLNKNMVIEAMVVGKVATFVHVFFIVWLFLCYFSSCESSKIDNFLLGLSSVLVIISLINYVIIGARRYSSAPRG